MAYALLNIGQEEVMSVKFSSAVIFFIYLYFIQITAHELDNEYFLGFPLLGTRPIKREST